jgi:hypothetical protein
MDGWMDGYVLLIQAGGQVYKRASSATSILLTFCPPPVHIDVVHVCVESLYVCVHPSP